MLLGTQAWPRCIIWGGELERLTEDIVQTSLALLKEERELFDKAMVFQAAAIEAVMCGGPITDDGLRAAICLASYAFDMLLCGWNALIHGFYSVALHSVRSIDQATITAIAVTLDQKVAEKFWEDKLNDGDASKAWQRALKKEDADFGEVWGQRRIWIRSLFHRFMHPSRTAVSPAIVIADDYQSCSPTLGGFFVEAQCLRLGRLYADLAFKAAVDNTQAFKMELSPEGKLKQQFDELVELGKPLRDRWAKEMGFL